MVSHPRRLWIAALGLVLVGGLAAFGLRAGSAAASTGTATAAASPTITVSGTGSAKVTPDQAQVDLGVTAQAATAQAALADDSSKMQAVVTAIQGQGVAQADLQTTGLSLSPNYAGGGPDAAPKITGFQASNNVDVTLHGTTQVGAVIDAALAAGANQVGGVSFSTSQPQAAYAAAYKAAMADAQASAQALASAAGLQLGTIQSIRASRGGGTVVPYAAAVTSAAGAVPPVFGGQQTVTVSLQVIYNIGG